MTQCLQLDTNKENESVTAESHKRLAVSLKPTQTIRSLNLVHMGFSNRFVHT